MHAGAATASCSKILSPRKKQTWKQKTAKITTKLDIQAGTRNTNKLNQKMEKKCPQASIQY